MSRIYFCYDIILLDRATWSRSVSKYSFGERALEKHSVQSLSFSQCPGDSPVLVNTSLGRKEQFKTFGQ